MYARPSVTNGLTFTSTFLRFAYFFFAPSFSMDFLFAGAVVGRLISRRIKRRCFDACTKVFIYCVLAFRQLLCAGNSYHVIYPYIFITHTQIQSFQLPTHRFPFVFSFFCFFFPSALPFLAFVHFTMASSTHTHTIRVTCFFSFLFLHHLLVFAFIKSIMCFCFPFFSHSHTHTVHARTQI